jgi:hypothetical protein
VSKCDLEALIMRRSWPTMGFCDMQKKSYTMWPCATQHKPAGRRLEYLWQNVKRTRGKGERWNISNTVTDDLQFTLFYNRTTELIFLLK